MSVTLYPAEAITAIQRIVSMLTRSTPADRDRLAKDIWLTIGFAQGLLLSDPDSPNQAAVSYRDPAVAKPGVLSADTTVVLSPRDAVMCLRMLAECSAAAGTNRTAGLGSIGATLTRWLSGMVVPLLLKWLTEYLSQKDGLAKLIDLIASPPQSSAAGGEVAGTSFSICPMA